VIEEELELRETFGTGLTAHRDNQREIARYDGPGTDLT
jgi:hypothetical protein